MAERDVPSGLAAVLVAAMPLVVVVLRRLAGEPVARATAIGVMAGFAGVAVLLLPGNPASGAGALGLGLILVATVSMAVASFVSSRLPVPGDTLVATALELLAAGVVLCLAGLLTGETADLALDRVSGASLAAFVYLVVGRYGTPFVVAERIGLGALVFLLGRFAVVAVHETAHGLTMASFGRRIERAGLKAIATSAGFVNSTQPPRR